MVEQINQDKSEELISVISISHEYAETEVSQSESDNIGYSTFLKICCSIFLSLFVIVILTFLIVFEIIVYS